MEQGQKDDRKDEKKAGPFKKWLLAGALATTVAALGACGDYTVENHIPIPNPTAQKDAGPSDGGNTTDAGQDMDGGSDGGNTTDAGQDLDAGQGGSDGGQGGQDGGVQTDAGQDLDAGTSDGGQGGSDGGVVNDAGQDLDGGQGGSDAGQDLDGGQGGSDGGQGGQDGGVQTDAGVDLDAGQGGSDGGVVPSDGGQDGGVVDLDGGSDAGQINQHCGSASTGSYSGYINKFVPIVVGGYSFYLEGLGSIPDGGVESPALISIKCGATVIVPTEAYDIGVEKSFDIVPDNKRIKVFPTQSGAGSAVVHITVEEIPVPNDGGLDAGPVDAGPDASDGGGYNPPACVEATTGTYSGYVNKITPVTVGGYVFLYSGTVQPDGGPMNAKYNIACGGSPVATDISCQLNADTVLDVPADYRRITLHPTQAGTGSSVVSIKVEYH
jgi:hypothetical protein